MRLLIALGLFFSINAYSQNYRERLSFIEEMAQNQEATADQNLGIFGGIYVQTEWQLKTGRSEFEAWSHINYYLTVAPYEIFSQYLRSGKKICSRGSRFKLCVAWVKYFEHAQKDSVNFLRTPFVKRKALKLLWEAHEASINYALLVKPQLLETLSLPEEERLYLKGWIKFVHVLAKTTLPTSEKFVRLMASPSSPKCSPLGAAHCELRDLPVSTRTFVKQMIRLGAR